MYKTFLWGLEVAEIKEEDMPMVWLYPYFNKFRFNNAW